MKEFSSDEIVQLKRNPNTFNVNRFRLYLTKAAKEEVVRLREKNYSYTRIFEELGYDISIIGKGRARGAVDHICNHEIKSDIGLHEGYARSTKRIKLTEIESLKTDKESVIKLKNEVLYLRQEMDFLKKISCLVNTEKRRK
jgi:hypothetical protein